MRVNCIAEKEAIRPYYVEQILIHLKSHGLVHSYRGVHGGFSLACDPSKLTVADILTSVEGSIKLAPCLENSCSRAPQCVTRLIWEKATDAMNRIFSQTTLYAMTEQAESILELEKWTHEI